MCSLINLEWLIEYEDKVQSLLDMSLWCLFCDPHMTTHQSNIGIFLGKIIE